MTTRPAQGPSRKPNALALQSSPYLLQHAHNPVDWRPWGPAAFEEARRRDVPVFVSIGYSTCYWCHVMERESFEDEAVARVVNERFVCIKVDREEHPDVDDACMAAVQMLTGQGGWPLNIFLEPVSGRPFWGGTYFPPVPAHGRPSFTQVVQRLSDAYRTQRAEVLEQARTVADEVARVIGAAREPVRVGAEQPAMALRTLLTIADPVNGGFGAAPKFPQPANLRFLLGVRDHADGEDTRAAIDRVLTLTLNKMALGGVFDQVGGGFHRYSTDALWLVPHFEKMLYDQAQLLDVYAHASVVYGDPFYAHVAGRTAEYLAREMTHASGAFFSAQDAEVDGREGLNYLWTPAMVLTALTPEDAAWAGAVYGLDQGPNFRDPHHPSDPPMNVMRLAERPEEIARREGTSLDEVMSRLAGVNAALLAARATRPRPALDDKIITAWNGQMIAALARAGMRLGERGMVEAAARAADAILQIERDHGRLPRAVREGRGEAPAVLDDYACLISGLVALHRAEPHELRWLAQAERLAAEAKDLFADPASDGYFDARADGHASPLFVRPRTTYDGAVPSPAGTMLHNLIDLAEVTRAEPYLESARGLLLSVSSAIAESPAGTIESTLGLLRLLTMDSAGTAAALSRTRARAGRPADDADPVEVLVSDDELVLGPDQPAELMIRLNIAPGYHINSAYAGSESGGLVIPLSIGVTGGQGVRAYADYPKGEPMEGVPHTVHTGRVELRVALEAEGEFTGSPRLTLTYQACDDRACLRPVTSVLDVHLVWND